MTDVHDVYAFVGIVFIAIISYGIFSKLRGRKNTVLIILGPEGEHEDIRLGAIEAGADLKTKVVFSTPETFEEDIDQHIPNSIVAFSNVQPPKGRAQRFFNGRTGKINRPADAFAAGYLAVVSGRVNFMSEEFEEEEEEEKDGEKITNTASPFRGRF
jgi:hypothetical protein